MYISHYSDLLMPRLRMDSDAIGQDWCVAAPSCAILVSVHTAESETRLASVACKFLSAKRKAVHFTS